MKSLLKKGMAATLAASIAATAVTIVPNSPITPTITADAATKVLKSGEIVLGGPTGSIVYNIKKGKVYTPNKKTKLFTGTLEDPNPKNKVYKVKKGVTYKKSKVFTGKVKYLNAMGYVTVTYKKGLVTKVVM